MSYLTMKPKILLELFKKCMEEWSETAGRKEFLKLEKMLAEELRRWKRQKHIVFAREMTMETFIRMHLMGAFARIENQKFRDESGVLQIAPTGKLLEILFSEKTAEKVFGSLIYGNPDFLAELAAKAAEKRFPKHLRKVV